MILNNFLKNLRELMPREAVPKDIDTPKNGKDLNEDIFWGTLKNPGNWAPVENEKLGAAKNGTLRAVRPYFSSGGISKKEYDSFVDNRDVFRDMLTEWGKEDNPAKRIGIMREYSNKYGFADNPIFADYMRNLDYYDRGELRGVVKGDSFVGPVSPFSTDKREEWVNYLNEASDEAVRLFTPYRSA